MVDAFFTRYGEDILACGSRETKEETGLDLYNLTAGPVLNAINRDTLYHYLVVTVQGVINPTPHFGTPDFMLLCE